MNVDIVRKIVGIVLLSFLIVIGFLNPVKQIVNIPNEIKLFQNEEAVITNMPAFSTANKDNEDTLSIEKSDSDYKISGHHAGSDSITVNAGNFPVKKVAVDVLPELRVVPGGHSVGVKMNTYGVLVVGHHLIETTKGEKSPGETAGIKVGDVITQINGQEVKKMTDLSQYIERAGKTGEELNFTVLREEKTLQKTIKPVKDNQGDDYRIGLYIRDSTAGVGTLTFFDPKSKRYGALGHVISDMDTKKPIAVNNGQILQSSITAVEKSSDGNPGEKLASFTNDKPLGTITRNSPFGIFGKLHNDIQNSSYNKPLPIALSKDVKEGPAKILTVLEGNKIESFDVEVVSTVPQKFPATKGMVIKIKDPKLLEKTGGIVQGMSGSPIIQNGKLIGAVTHVFVNDATSGYGVHIEWMLKEAGIDIYNESNEEQKREAS